MLSYLKDKREARELANIMVFYSFRERYKHICMCVYLSISLSLYIYISIYLYMYVCIYIYIYICIHICIHIHALYIEVCDWLLNITYTYNYIYIYTYMYMCTNMYIYIYIYIHIYIYIYNDTNNHNNDKWVKSEQHLPGTFRKISNKAKLGVLGGASVSGSFGLNPLQPFLRHFNVTTINAIMITCHILSRVVYNVTIIYDSGTTR